MSFKLTYPSGSEIASGFRSVKEAQDHADEHGITRFQIVQTGGSREAITKRFRITERKLNGGGYDEHGRYFGKTAQKLYDIEDKYSQNTGQIRARDRADAIRKVTEEVNTYGYVRSVR